MCGRAWLLRARRRGLLGSNQVCGSGAGPDPMSNVCSRPTSVPTCPTGANIMFEDSNACTTPNADTYPDLNVAGGINVYVRYSVRRVSISRFPSDLARRPRVACTSPVRCCIHSVSRYSCVRAGPITLEHMFDHPLHTPTSIRRGVFHCMSVQGWPRFLRDSVGLDPYVRACACVCVLLRAGGRDSRSMDSSF